MTQMWNCNNPGSEYKDTSAAGTYGFDDGEWKNRATAEETGDTR